MRVKPSRRQIRWNRVIALSAALVLLGAPASAHADGGLDRSFSGDGRTTTDFGKSVDEAFGVAAQPDGKIVVAGSRLFGRFSFAVARYDRNGSLDPTFSGNGKTIVSFRPSTSARATDVAVDAEGRIVVVGTYANRDIALARFNPDGSPDRSFSEDGLDTIDLGRAEAAARIALRPDGRLLVAGTSTREDDRSDLLVVSLNADGTLDETFSDDGHHVIDFGPSDVGSALALQPDGRILVGGGPVYEDPRRGGYFAVARLTAGGDSDRRFSGNGRTTVSVDADGFASDLALARDGKIALAGPVGYENPDFGVVRLAPNGSPDRTFSGDGRQTTDFGNFDAATAVAVQGDGKIIASGYSSGQGFALARYTRAGAPDPSFAGDGRQTTGFGEGGLGIDMTLVRGERIVVVGSAAGLGPKRRTDFALARYLGSGGGL